MRDFMQDRFKVAFMVVALAGLAACNENTGSQDGGADLAAPPDASGPAQLTRDVQPIFTNFCSPCHISQTPRAGGLDLAAGAAYASLVTNGQSSCTLNGTQQTLVVAGAPSQSYLINKLVPGSAICGQPMPLGRASLSTAQVDTIRSWITAGAQNN